MRFRAALTMGALLVVTTAGAVFGQGFQGGLRGSVKDSAAELKLHRHTVLYRLDRLRQLLGRNLDEPATRLRLQLAIGLRKLL